MRLKKNEMAPSFKIMDMNNNIFDLNKSRSKPLMLSFFRYASCPLCNLRVHELIKNYNNLKNSIDIILIFQSPKEKIDKYVGKQNIPYVIIPNPDKTLYHLYSVENSWFGFAKTWTAKISRVFKAVVKHHYHPGSVEGEIHRIPADFILDTNNKVLCAFYGRDIGDHIPLSDFYTLVENYETG